MSDQQQPQVQGEQPQGQMSLSDFLLSQRRTVDQIIANYENNMAQFAQTVEQLQKRIEELEGKSQAGSDG